MAPDLTKQFPRSPKERLGGFIHLPRMSDKARAKTADTLGEYLYPCPLDQSLLDFLGISSEAFLEAVKERDDREIVEWIRKESLPRTPQEIEEWNREFLEQRPQDEKGRRRFEEKLRQLAPNRTDVKGWIDLLDLEEGREVPVRI